MPPSVLQIWTTIFANQRKHEASKTLPQSFLRPFSTKMDRLRRALCGWNDVLVPAGLLQIRTTTLADQGKHEGSGTLPESLFGLFSTELMVFESVVRSNLYLQNDSGIPKAEQ
ncbi:hypothetical protein Slin14017_G034430 [Septoria linicola]|nr:hypothetical protein Slin14017_G034430 [Septoria linicola]